MKTQLVSQLIKLVPVLQTDLAFVNVFSLRYLDKDVDASYSLSGANKSSLTNLCHLWVLWAKQAASLQFLLTDPANTEKHLFRVVFLALFWSPLAPKGNIWLIGCWMLHCVHQLFVNFVFVPFGDGYVLSSESVRGLSTDNSCKVAESMRLNLHSESHNLKPKTSTTKASLWTFFSMTFWHVWSVQWCQNDIATYDIYLSVFSLLAFSAPLLTRQVDCSADHIKHNTFLVCQRGSTHKNTMKNIKWYYLRLASTVLSRGVASEIPSTSNVFWQIWHVARVFRFVF